MSSLTFVSSALLLLSSCNCPGFAATPKAGFERMAAARLQNCIQGNLCQVAPWCFEQSRQFCLDAGYPKTCGQMEHEGTCGSKVK